MPALAIWMGTDLSVMMIQRSGGLGSRCSKSPVMRTYSERAVFIESGTLIVSSRWEPLFSSVLPASIAVATGVAKSFGSNDVYDSLMLLSSFGWNSRPRMVMMDMAYSPLTPMGLADSFIMRLNGALAWQLA